MRTPPLEVMEGELHQINTSEKKLLEPPDNLPIEVKETIESDIEKTESVLLELERIENDIEDNAEIFEESNLEGSLFEKMEKIISKATKETTRFLKQYSEVLAKYPRKVAELIKDKRLVRASEKLQEKLVNSDAIAEARNAMTHTENRDEKIIRKGKRKFSSIHKRSENLVKTVESGMWGKSSKRDEALREISRFLERGCSVASDLGLEDESFKILTALEHVGVPDHYMGKDSLRDALSSILVAQKNKYFKSDDEKTKPEDIKKAFRDDPYLKLSYLSSLGRSPKLSKENQLLGIESLEQLEKKNNPTVYTKSIVGMANGIAMIAPETFLADQHAREYLFEINKNVFSSYEGRTCLTKSIPLFAKQLGEISNEEKNKIIFEFEERSEIATSEGQILLSSLPLNEKDFEKIYQGLALRGPEDKKTRPYSRENFLDLLGMLSHDEKSYIQLLHHKALGITKEKRLELLDLIEFHAERDDAFLAVPVFLEHYKEIFADLDEEEADRAMKHLISKSVSGGDKGIYSTLSFILEEYPESAEKYRKILNSSFTKGLSSDLCAKLMGIESETSRYLGDLDLIDEKIQKNPEIMEGIEASFLLHGHDNDIRHTFYKIINKEQTIKNYDDFVEGYAKRIYSIEHEEYLTLFLIDKKLDRKFGKVFAQKLNPSGSIVGQLEEKINLRQITKEEHDWMLEEIIVNAPYKLSLFAFSQYMNTRAPEAIDSEFFQSYIKHILIGLKESKNGMDHILSGQIKRLSHDHKIQMLNNLFTDLIDNESQHATAFDCAFTSDWFEVAFPTDDLKREYATKLFATENPIAISKLIEGSNVLRNKNSHETTQNVFWKTLNDEDRQKFFNRAVAHGEIQVQTAFLLNFSAFDTHEQERIIQNILENELFKNGDEQSISAFCAALASILRNNEGGYISQTEALIKKVLESAKITKGGLGYILQICPSVFAINTDISNRLIECDITAGLDLDRQIIRSRYSLNLPLPEDQLIRISQQNLKKHAITGEMYMRYLEGYFYLDAEMLNKNIDSLKNGSFYFNNLDTLRDIIDFLKLQRTTKLQDSTRTVCADGDEAAIVNTIFKAGSAGTSTFEQLNSFDQNIFEETIRNNFENRNYSFQNIIPLLSTRQELFQSLSNETIEFVVHHPQIASGGAEALIKRYKDNPVLLAKIKSTVNELVDPIQKTIFFRELLVLDCLNSSELRDYYEASNKTEDIRDKVLTSAEILGSLVSVVNLENLKEFLNGEESIKELEYVSSFVKKYELMNKGRTIAVMLFAREYMPERTPEEIIQKVANRLRKYERVLERYTYSEIPEGLHVSLGMEYEITGSTAEGYKQLTDRDLKKDIVRLSQAAHIGSGRDAVHEIATKPATNPYMMLLELQVLNDLEYIDFNFDRSTEYQKGSRGYHLTLGGEKGLEVNQNIYFLQNTLLGASWGGIFAGEIGKRVSGGRGVTVRGREISGTNNVQVFNKATPSVELRALSIDKLEPFQRSVLASYHGAIAIQALEKYTNIKSGEIPLFIEKNLTFNEEEFINALNENNQIRESISDPKIKTIIFSWAKLVKSVYDAAEYHNELFLDGETQGYFDQNGNLIETTSFGGEYNKKRFESVVSSIDPTLSIQEYVNNTKIEFSDLLSGFDVELADSFTKINNLYLKPSTTSTELSQEGKQTKVSIRKGDQANAAAMLSVTKLSNEHLEERSEKAYLEGTIFNTLGERREGYYNVQGASEKMFTHALQRALLEFNREMEEILNKKPA